MTHSNRHRHLGRRIPLHCGPASGTRLALFRAAAWVALASAGCIGSIENPAGIGEPDQWTVSVTLENVGNGAGRVAVEPSAGSVMHPCPDRIAPGETCRVVIEHRQAIASVLLDAAAEDGSEFTGYAGACSGGEPECRIQVPREGMVSLRVDVSFTLTGFRASRMP